LYHFLLIWVDKYCYVANASSKLPFFHFVQLLHHGQTGGCVISWISGRSQKVMKYNIVYQLKENWMGKILKLILHLWCTHVSSYINLYNATIAKQLRNLSKFRNKGNCCITSRQLRELILHISLEQPNCYQKFISSRSKFCRYIAMPPRVITPYLMRVRLRNRI
jgi:hypothetical protein